MQKIFASVFLVFCLFFLGSPASAQNVVTDWSSMIQPAVLSNGAGGARSPGTAEVLHTTIQLAMYDAAMAIEGGYAPFAANLSAPAGADVRAGPPIVPRGSGSPRRRSPISMLSTPRTCWESRTARQRQTE